MGQTCFDERFTGRYELAKLAREEGVEFEDLTEADFVSGYEHALEKTVESVENINSPCFRVGERTRGLRSIRKRLTFALIVRVARHVVAGIFPKNHPLSNQKL